MTGDAQMAREKLLSLFGHILGLQMHSTPTKLFISMGEDFECIFLGTHYFPLNEKFTECAHSNLDDTQSKEYIKPGLRSFKDRFYILKGTMAILCF